MKGTPVGNGPWSRDRWRHVTMKVKLVKVATPICLWINISQTDMGWRQWNTYRKPHTVERMITW